MTDDVQQPAEEPAQLRFLRILVTTLTAVMILGLLTIIGLFVMRFWGPSAPSATASYPSDLTLPEGLRATAYTQGEGWSAIVTDSQQILIFDSEGNLRQTIAIELE